MRKSELRLRILTAAVGIPVLVLFLETGGIPFTLFVTFINILALRELFNLFKEKGFSGYKFPSFIASFFLLFVAHTGKPLLVPLFFTACPIFLLFLYLIKGKIQGALNDLSMTFFSLFYPSLLLAHAVSLRNYGNNGKFFLYLSIAVTMLNDTGGYFAGRLAGKHKLAPSVSPGKTVEGFFGGLVLGIPSGMTICTFRSCPLLFSGTLSLLICLSAVAGDLAESLLKRDAGVKDTGSFFPGHGGVLDRIDSLLFSIPATYYFVYFAGLK